MLASLIKLMWKDNPTEMCTVFFQKLGDPSWRSVKLLEALVRCMKDNNSPDFSISTDTHKYCLNAYYHNGFKQVHVSLLSYQ